MLTSYAEIDLSETPCIFLPCGHIFTVESLDGIMAMSDHYELDTTTGMPLALKKHSKAYSYEEVKTCPDCRSSLRLVPRYGRIVRRALLDECTKKFITWSNRKFMEFAKLMQALQARLIETRSTVSFPAGNVILSRSSHIRVLGELPGIGQRYRPLLALREQIDVFLKETSAEEQPFKRVQDIVESLRRRRLADGEPIHAFDFDKALLQSRGSLLATALAIRCEIVAISDFVVVYNAQRKRLNLALEVDFSECRESCETLVELAISTSNILQQAEGYMFWAHLAALECEVMNSRDSSNSSTYIQDIKRIAETHLDRAKALCTRYPGQTSSVVAEIEDVRRVLIETGYQSQMRMVVAAMQGEFSGTGHWYRCENGHPFTVGECGMPMQVARCPQCDAPIGGSNHRPAAGVVHASDIERDFGSMQIRG
ncbi:hypothetical protein MBLNU13_g08918t2 [Cladosporium sp. NU13]